MDKLQRARHQMVAKELAAATQNARVMSKGWRFTLPITPRTLALAAEFISRERLCCPFLMFTQTIPAGASSWSFEIRGPSGTTQFLGSALGLSGGDGPFCATVELPEIKVRRQQWSKTALSNKPRAVDSKTESDSYYCRQSPASRGRGSNRKR